MSLSSMMLALSACRQSQDKIVPLVEPDKFRSDNEILFYNTIFTNKNFTLPIRVKTKDGKPTKITGNPDFDSGAIDAKAQATIYELLHPERLRKPKVDGQEKSLELALESVYSKLNNFIILKKNILFIMNEHSSRFINKFIDEIQVIEPSIKFFHYPTVYSNEAKLNNDLLSINAEIIPDFNNIDLFISLEADILGSDKFAPYYQNQISKRKSEKLDFKLITIESAFTLTGLNSDRRICVRKEEIEALLATLILKLANAINFNMPKEVVENLSKMNYNNSLIINELIDELISHKNRIFIKSGIVSSDKTMVLAILLNYMLNSYENRLYFVPHSGDKSKKLIELYEILEKPNDVLIITLDFDLFYYVYGDLNKILIQIPYENIISLSLIPDNTANHSSINIPLKHNLESWGDAQFLNQDYAIRQPIVEPINHDSISIEEFLLFIKSKLLNIENKWVYDELKSIYQLSEDDWINALKNGYILNNHNYLFNNRFRPERIINYIEKIDDSDAINLLLLPSPFLFDGTFSSVPWLNELPDPLTGVCWMNPVNVSRYIAEKYDLKDGDVIEISYKNSRVNAPVIVSSEIADDTIVGYYGYGRDANKLLPNDTGVNFFKIKDKSTVLSNSIPVSIQKTQAKLEISYLNKLNKFDLNHLKLNKYSDTSNNILVILDDMKNKSINKWIMIIDTNKCLGCNSCILACQIENNIPFVGKEEIIRGRNLHWISHSIIKSEKKFRNIVIMCQHCQNAPCEKVCPVSASSHSDDGINETTYNRCVGTRYCMANCPYKVRKFNYFNYSSNFSTPINLMLNPSVTVRSRGIVEKCTFCIQRINEFKRNENISMRIQTACQEVCPARAINFGNIKYHGEYLRKMIENKRVVRLLEEFNTEPSVWYIV